MSGSKKSDLDPEPPKTDDLQPDAADETGDTDATPAEDRDPAGHDPDDAYAEASVPADGDRDAEDSAEDSADAPEADSLETAPPVPEAEGPPDPDLAAAAAPEVVERVIETRRGGFLPAVIGGILAAALGFLAAKSDSLDALLPPQWRDADYTAQIAELDERATDQTARIDALSKTVEDLDIPDIGPVAQDVGALRADLSGLGDRITSLGDDIAAMGDRLDGFDTRLTELEKRPINEGVSEAAIAAYERELSALQEAMAAQRAEVENLLAEAQAKQAEARAAEGAAAKAAETAATRAVLTQLVNDLNAGASYAARLDTIEQAGLDVPDALRAPSADGVATLAELRSTFPPAARAALAAARIAGEDGTGGLQAFLTRQLGARSVVPREGDDPDAVLSRAEAALAGGDLAQALAEIDTLPDEARSAMTGWAETARTRLDATNAADALLQSLNSN